MRRLFIIFFCAIVASVLGYISSEVGTSKQTYYSMSDCLEQHETISKFVGIWTPDNTNGNQWIGKIKISEYNGKLLVQVKRGGEIHKCDDVTINGNIRLVRVFQCIN